MIARVSKIVFMTPQQYLEFEQIAVTRHEYVDGIVYEMPGETLLHNRVAGRIYAKLLTQESEYCKIAFEGVQLWLSSLNRYYYPDVMVLCDSRDTDPRIFQYPCFIAEVASPSTESTDRREKLSAYRDIETLQGYLIVDLEAKAADYFERTPQGWQQTRLEGSGELEVKCLNTTLKLEEVLL